MSLKLWLPLMGDFHNQGLDGDINFTITGTVSDADNGKLGGKCKKFSLSNVVGAYEFTLGDTASMAFWVKFSAIPTGSTNRWVVDFANTSSYGDSLFGFSLRGANAVVCVKGKYDYTHAHDMVEDKWYHVVVVWNNPIAYLYVDGQLKYTFDDRSDGTLLSSSKMSLGANVVSTSSSRLSGYLNDFRLYDHALSVKEVHEISKGLILHYPLDESYFNENLMPNSLTMALGASDYTTGVWRTAGSNTMTRKRVVIHDTPDGDGYGFQNSGVQTSTTDASCYGMDGFVMEPNTIYTISMWARLVDGSDAYAGFEVRSKTLLGGSHVEYRQQYYITPLPSDGSWIKCWMCFQTNSSVSRNIYIGIVTEDTEVVTQMCNVHLEKGQKDRSIVYDTSGYSRHMTITGTIEAAGNSARNSTCAYFPECSEKTNYAISDDKFTMPGDAVTINVWVKIPSDVNQITNYAEPINLAGSYYEMGIYGLNGKTYARLGLYVDGTRYVANSPAVAIDDQWHMYSITYDGSVIRRYLNGKEYSNTEVEGILYTASQNWFIGTYGNNANYTCNKVSESDVRIYTTALSAEDILELYQASANIDKSGNVWGYEFYEDSGAIPSIQKNGVIQASEFDSQDNLASIYKTGEIYANEIKEV